MKGEQVNCLSTNLVDITGNYSKEPHVAVPGGQLLQIYYVFEEIIRKYPQGLNNYVKKKVKNDDEDYFLRPNNPRELLLPEHLMPFLMQYLKDMKNEAIEIFLNKECKEFLDARECPYDDLSGLSEDELCKFKELFV